MSRRLQDPKFLWGVLLISLSLPAAADLSHSGELNSKSAQATEASTAEKPAQILPVLPVILYHQGMVARSRVGFLRLSDRGGKGSILLKSGF